MRILITLLYIPFTFFFLIIIHSNTALSSVISSIGQDDSGQLMRSAQSISRPSSPDLFVSESSSPRCVLIEFVRSFIRLPDGTPNDSPVWTFEWTGIEHDNSTSAASSEAESSRTLMHEKRSCEPAPETQGEISSSHSEQWENVAEEYTECLMEGCPEGGTWILRIYGFGFEIDLGNILIPTERFSLCAAYELGLIPSDQISLKDLRVLKKSLLKKSVTGVLSETTIDSLRMLREKVKGNWAIDLEAATPLEILFPLLKKFGLKRVDHQFQGMAPRDGLEPPTQ